LVALDRFLNKYPQGHDIAAARALASRLQQEEIDWHAAQEGNSLAAYQTFLRNYPQSPYAEQARAEIRKLEAPKAAVAQATANNDGDAVMSALRRFSQAFDQKDAGQLSSVWPTLRRQELKKIRDSFNDAESIHMDLKPTGELRIDGQHASVTCLRSLSYVFKGGIQKSEENTVTIQLDKQSGTWVIQSVQ
jgi:hypothetical protein